MPMLAPRISAVLVDSGGVLVHPNPGMIRPFASKLEIGTFVQALYAAAIDERILDPIPLDDIFPEADIWWRHNAAVAIGCHIPIGNLAAAVDALFTAYRTPDLHAYPASGARDGLAALVAAGYRIAVVTNHDGTMEHKLARSGICQVGPGQHVPVNAIIDSGAVGFGKPDPRIFELALASLEVEPAVVIHVGDTDPDILGAEAAGIHALTDLIS